MKLSSFSTLARHAGETFKRFPLALLSAIAGTTVMLFLIHKSFSGGDDWQLSRLAMATYLSMLLAITVALYSERFTFSASKKYLSYVLSLIIVALYYFSLPAEFNETEAMRFALFTIGLHLLVAFSPFMVRGEMNGMWQFNKSIFIRILTSALYSGVLYAGLALAMFAVQQLFDVKIKGEYYADLWIVISGMFNTWFFLSGVPENIPSLNDRTDYPKGLKIFTVYVLLPLITIYMVILYLYAGKIVITSNWPVGWVGYMVIAFAIFGILSFLLIYPLRDDESNLWVKSYSKLFYFLLIVPIVLLFTAIYKRINQYGITEERYFVLVLAFWLSFITLYFMMTNGKNIRIIPLSLCIVVFLTSFGPWGAFSVSHNSQFNELTTLLDSNHVLVNGKADTTKSHDVDSKDYDRIKDIVRYLSHMHGHEMLQNYFSVNLDSLIAEDKKDNSASQGETNLILDLLQLNKIESADDSNAKNFRSNEKLLFNSSGYDYVKIFSLNYVEETLEFFFEADTIRLINSREAGTITLQCRDFEPLVLDTKEMLASLPGSNEDAIPVDRLTLEADNRQWKTKIIFSSLNCSRQNGKLKTDYASGMLMLKINFEEENEVGEKGTK
ncbi:MAG TPA: DUF4153 domain-containing protein [Bacteroidia bacterium]|nr:DUF4153 domain-containing protein [Bacteroidia bacterium]